MIDIYKITSEKDLNEVQTLVQKDWQKYKGMVRVCTGTGCVAAKGFDIRDKFKKVLKAYNIDKDYLVIQTGCNGFCAVGPICVIQPQGVFYQKVKEEDVEEVVVEHLINGNIVERLLYKDPSLNISYTSMDQIPFFNKQQLIALRNKGLIDPENINHYIARGGYKSLAKVLNEYNSEQVIDEVLVSGLRGRGGGGFPTGIKWQSARKAAQQRDDEVYVVCNADEGDPGAFMDRSIIETDPHSIIEGMLIAAYAVGAKEGFVYIRKEYPLALQRLQIAIKQAKQASILGNNIFGKDFSFDIKIHVGAGAFVCGEETALMNSVEGRVGEPRQKPPFPVEKGIHGKPTIINNVETWANIPVIIERGAKWFSSIGSGDVNNNPWGGSSGTKVFSLVGKIKNTGLVEVPMGITLREIIYDIGGGMIEGRKFKAVQTGGPSGGCLPESKLDMRVDFDSLIKAGSMMGSGGMIVMDDKTCMIDVAKYFIEFLMDESCGKCTPCREGLVALYKILNRICNGEGKAEDIELLYELSNTIKETSLCQLGGSAPNPVLSTLQYFREEYEEHIFQKKCRAGVCKSLITYRINDNCTGCMVCLKNCPTSAINGQRKQKHFIDVTKCIKCGVCEQVCKFNAVEVY